EGSIELDDAIEAAEQHLAQRDAARRPVPFDLARIVADFDRQQFFHLLAQKSEAVVGDAARRREDVKKVGRQAIMERGTSFWADVDAVALQPIGGCAVPFIKRDAYARLVEPLSQGEATDTTADNADVKAFVRHASSPISCPVVFVGSTRNVHPVTPWRPSRARRVVRWAPAATLRSRRRCRRTRAANARAARRRSWRRRKTL